MTDGAARQRRLRERRRRHRAGDHEECLPSSCAVARAASVDLDADGGNEPYEHDSDGACCTTGDVTGDVTDTPKDPVTHRALPADLGPRGRRLWDEMAGLKLGPTHVLLLERACRKADRLEVMDAALRGRAWLDLVEVPDTDGAVLQVVVDKLLSEIRQTEIALKLDIAELRHAARPATAAGHTPPAGDPGGETTSASSPTREGAAGGNVTSIAAIRGTARG